MLSVPASANRTLIANEVGRVHFSNDREGEREGREGERDDDFRVEERRRAAVVCAHAPQPLLWLVRVIR